MALRDDFPKAGDEYLGGQCNGWQYSTAFSSTTLKQTYAMVRLFLEEEGYGDIPLPSTAKELAYFRSPGPKQQYGFFQECGYFHNPIKIIFPSGKRKSQKLVLCIYNETEPNHLIKFHGLLKEVV